VTWTGGAAHGYLTVWQGAALLTDWRSNKTSSKFREQVVLWSRIPASHVESDQLRTEFSMNKKFQ